MTSAPEGDVHQCSNCPKTATRTCKACKLMPNATDGQPSSAWYCGAECQKAHWTEHKAQCRAAQAQQALYRAGALAQQIFYLFKKTTFMWSPGRIEKLERLGSSFQGLHRKKSTGAVPIRDHFRRLYSKIDEVQHFVKGAKHYLRRVYASEGWPIIDGTNYLHTLIRVTLKNGESYAVDIAGAQYGWRETVTPWQLYNTSRVREIKDVGPFGGTRVFCKTRANNTGGQQKWIHGISENFAKNVDEALTWWQRVNISSSDLLRLPEHDFQKRQVSLLACLDEFLQRSKAFQESRGMFDIGGLVHGGLDREFTSSALGAVSPEGLAFLTTA